MFLLLCGSCYAQGTLTNPSTGETWYWSSPGDAQRQFDYEQRSRISDMYSRIDRANNSLMERERTDLMRRQTEMMEQAYARQAYIDQLAMQEQQIKTQQAYQQAWQAYYLQQQKLAQLNQQKKQAEKEARMAKIKARSEKAKQTKPKD